MSLAAPIDSLLGLKAEDDCNTVKFKNRGDFSTKNLKILHQLAFMSNFQDLSAWVAINSNSQKYIAYPAHSSHEDRDSCLNHMQDLLAQAIKGANKRKDGRDLKLIKAAHDDDYYTLANILASAAWSYWLDHGFQMTSGSRMNINAALQLFNEEKSLEKKKLGKAQIDHIGVAVDFRKALKKGAFQEVFDFDETEEILKYEDFEV